MHAGTGNTRSFPVPVTGTSVEVELFRGENNIRVLHQ